MPLPSRTRARGAYRQDGGAHSCGERADGSNAGQSQGYGPGALSFEPLGGGYSRDGDRKTSKITATYGFVPPKVGPK